MEEKAQEGRGFPIGLIVDWKKRTLVGKKTLKWGDSCKHCFINGLF
jgi:hypothetical protein